jgi:hypothetical protein
MDNAEERRSGRSIVILTAAIERDGACIPVRVSNLSAHGALVVGNGLPPVDTEVTFRCNGVGLQSWIAWVDAARAGVQFSEPVQPDALAQKVRVPPIPVERDTRTVDFRRPGFRGNQMTVEERRIVDEWTGAPHKPRGNKRP